MSATPEKQRIAEIVAEFSRGLFTPADFLQRGQDIDEALVAIRKVRREEADARDRAEAQLRDKLRETQGRLAALLIKALHEAGFTTAEYSPFPGRIEIPL